MLNSVAARLSLRWFNLSDDVEKVARALYHSGCLRFGNFRIKSGASSPYYIDLASLLSSPRDLCIVADVTAEHIKRIRSVERVDKLASIELKGALILPSVGCLVDLPCVVVRKETKAYGVAGRTAGAEVSVGDHILFFDDVVSEGLSKTEGIKPLEQLGASVKSILVVVDREQRGKENLEQVGYKVYSLAKISELVDSLVQFGQISEEQHRDILEYVGKRQR